MDKETKAMHDILSKLKGVDKTTKIVAERAEQDVDLNIAINQKITESSVSVQNYRIDIVLQKFGDKQKRFYNICEDNKIIYKDVVARVARWGSSKSQCSAT